MPAQAQQFLDALGDKVTGDFGSGTVFKTRLVNALMTDDGKVYVGAVTKDALVKAADTAKYGQPLPGAGRPPPSYAPYGGADPCPAGQQREGA